MKINTLKELVSRNWNRPGRLWNLAKVLLLPKNEYVSYGPISADIETTLVCNLGCIMCHRRELARDRKVFTMTFEDFKKVLDLLPTILQVKLQGMGEPLLTPELPQMIRYARSKGIVTTFVSNGKIMDAEKAKSTIESGLDRIYFSIDSANPEQYAFYRRGGTLPVVVENVKTFMRVRKELGKKNPLTGIWMLLFESNLDQIKGVIDIAKETGVDEISIQTAITDRGKKNWKETIADMQVKNPDQVRVALEEARQYAKDRGVTFLVHEYVGGIFKKTKDSLCEWPWKSIYITSQGDVSPCCIIADPKVAGMGNIYQKDFRSLWNDAAYKDFRKKLLVGDIPSPCSGCYGREGCFKKKS